MMRSPCCDAPVREAGSVIRYTDVIAGEPTEVKSVAVRDLCTRCGRRI
jgi:hypothetical protein